ncbi:GntR family transcriptional regulator [Falsiroseomonas ponticola]|uniref:GntR family transcriptional regulator n=1 Tax=Falsiroseomonas ponticola TaxID=2786951 RepID=UPI001933F292|nr:GntR family transcriptional regulator [Roseomonas ponticola]
MLDDSTATAPSPTPEARNRVDALADALRDRVLGGLYSPGHRLVEAALVAEFGTSRGVVREAFQRLAAEGVLEIAANRGAAVRRLARADVAAVAPVREALEGLAARLAAPAAHAARDRLMASLAEQRAAEDAGDPVGAFARANITFHHLVLDLAANPRLAEALRPLTLPLSRLIYARLFDRAARLRSAEEHARVVAALLMGDGAAAEAGMRLHVRNACAELLLLPDAYLA